MQKREAKLQVLFKHYLSSVGWSQSSVFELKQSQTDTLRKGSLLPHQRDSLLNAKHSTLYHKLPDDTIGYKPFDCFLLANVSAFVVIKFRSGVVMVDIDNYAEPLHFETAKKIGKIIF